MFTILSIITSLIGLFMFSIPFWFIGKLCNTMESKGYVQTCWLGFKTIVKWSMVFYNTFKNKK